MPLHSLKPANSYAGNAGRTDRVETPWAQAMDGLATRFGQSTTADMLKALRRSHPDLSLSDRIAALSSMRR